MPGKPYQKQSAGQCEASGIGSAQQDGCLLPSVLHLVHVPCTKTQSDKMIGPMWGGEVKGISECQPTQLHQNCYKNRENFLSWLVPFTVFLYWWRIGGLKSITNRVYITQGNKAYVFTIVPICQKASPFSCSILVMFPGERLTNEPAWGTKGKSYHSVRLKYNWGKVSEVACIASFFLWLAFLDFCRDTGHWPFHLFLNKKELTSFSIWETRAAILNLYF